MPTHQVMDATGHTEHAWDKADVVKAKQAEARFRELTRKGFVAVAPGLRGAPGRLLKQHDPDAETVIFHPQLQGG